MLAANTASAERGVSLKPEQLFGNAIKFVFAHTSAVPEERETCLTQVQIFAL